MADGVVNRNIWDLLRGVKAKDKAEQSWKTEQNSERATTVQHDATIEVDDSLSEHSDSPATGQTIDRAVDSADQTAHTSGRVGEEEGSDDDVIMAGHSPPPPTAAAASAGTAAENSCEPQASQSNGQKPSPETSSSHLTTRVAAVKEPDKDGKDTKKMIVGNIFDKAAHGLLKPAAKNVPAHQVKGISAVAQNRMSTFQPLDLSRITPALKCVSASQTTGELPLDLSTRKRPSKHTAQHGPPPKKHCLADTNGKLYEVVKNCARCKSNGVLSYCNHRSSDKLLNPLPAHQKTTTSLPNAGHDSQVDKQKSARTMVAGMGKNQHDRDASLENELPNSNKLTVLNNVHYKMGRHSPIELPSQPICPTRTSGDIVKHRGRAFIVSPVRPQIKGQPVGPLSATDSPHQTDNKVTKPAPCAEKQKILDGSDQCAKDQDQIKYGENAPIMSESNLTNCNSGAINKHSEKELQPSSTLLNIPTYTPVNNSNQIPQRVKTKAEKKERVRKKNEDKELMKQPLIPKPIKLPKNIMVARKSTRPHRPSKKMLEMVEISDLTDESPSPPKLTPPKIESCQLSRKEKQITPEMPTLSPYTPCKKRCSLPSPCPVKTNFNSQSDIFSFSPIDTSPQRNVSVISEPDSPGSPGTVLLISKDKTFSSSSSYYASKPRTTPKKFTRRPQSVKIVKLTDFDKAQQDKYGGSVRDLNAFMPTTAENSVNSGLNLSVLTTTAQNTFNPPSAVNVKCEKKISQTNYFKSTMLKPVETNISCKKSAYLGEKPITYSYPADTEPNHILTCDDWKEDLIRYKKNQLHLPGNIISVPQVTKPNFKAPLYVDIPRSKKFIHSKKQKKRCIKKTKDNTTVIGDADVQITQISSHDNLSQVKEVSERDAEKERIYQPYVMTKHERFRKEQKESKQLSKLMKIDKMLNSLSGLGVHNDVGQNNIVNKVKTAVPSKHTATATTRKLAKRLGIALQNDDVKESKQKESKKAKLKKNKCNNKTESLGGNQMKNIKGREKTIKKCHKSKDNMNDNNGKSIAIVGKTNKKAKISKLGRTLKENIVTPRSKRMNGGRSKSSTCCNKIGESGRKRRSILDELRNSDGFVADKRFRKTENLFADPSQLGREERALQRAMLQIAEMESKSPTSSMFDLSSPESTRMIKKAKANRALELKRRAIKCRPGKAGQSFGNDLNIEVIREHPKKKKVPTATLR